MNAANEVANNAFRNDHISLSDIPEIIKATMNAFNTNDYSFTLEVSTDCRYSQYSRHTTGR